MTQNGKRPRNTQEDDGEFMPLSKRINNLHINNSLLANHSNGQHSTLKVEWGPGPPNYIGHLPDSPPSSITQCLPEYAPDLDETENPHYFNINKLLFEMYIQRLQRGCHQI